MENTQQQEQEPGLTPELVKDLVQLLGNKSLEVRHGTISAILQYTPTPQSKHMFKDTALIAFLRKYIAEPQLTTICLSTLIHFASQTDLVPEYFKLIEPLILKMKEWKDLQLELSLLLLLNLSKEEEIVFRIIGQEDKKGYLIEVLYSLLEKQKKLRWILVGVFVNISALERGRRFFVEQGVFVRFIVLINEHEEKLREASLKILRNCSFQWQYQPFALQVLKPEHKIIAKVIKLILFLMIKQQMLHQLTHANLLANKVFAEGELYDWSKRMVTTDRAKALVELELCIDIILILSNMNLKQKETGIDSQLFKQLLSLLKFTEIKEETKDKLQALQIFGI